MADEAPADMSGSDELGHLLIMWKGKFYFIPADKIGPPITLEGEDLSTVMENIGLHQKDNSPDLIDFGLRIDRAANLIKITGHN